MSQYPKLQVDPVDIHVGARIKLLRKLKEVSQDKLAEHLGITFQQVQKYESGNNRISASKLWGVCVRFGVTPNFFFEGLETSTAAETNIFSDDELRAIDNVRRLEAAMREGVFLMLEAAARPGKVFKKTDGSVAYGSNKDLEKLIRPFGRLPNKQNYLTAQEATNLYQYFRDAVWKGQYDFSGCPWVQNSDGSWQRKNFANETMLVVKPDGCVVSDITKNEQVA
jgi:transcriptional regulator with XRE-family HTH domain